MHYFNIFFFIVTKTVRDSNPDICQKISYEVDTSREGEKIKKK